MRLNERKILTPIRLGFQIVVSVMLIAIQLFIYYLIFIGSYKIPYIYIISFIGSLILVIKLYNNSDNPSYKILWIIIILLFNVTGPLLYLCFGNGSNLPKRKYKKIEGFLLNKIESNDIFNSIKEKDVFAYNITKFLHNTTGLYPYNNCKDIFYPDGVLMFNSMLEAIDNAKKYIFMEYFIVASGYMLDELINHLEEASNRGVSIKFLYDYLGCNIPKVLNKKDIERLSNINNCEFHAYNPLGININLGINYRDHRKILLIDGEIAFVGGINIADEYIHKKEKYGYWRDNGMKICGDACYNYLVMFAQNWYMSTKEMLDISLYKAINKDLEFNDGYIFPFGDGPNNRLTAIYDLYLKLISNAKESIYISTPYFVIDDNFIKTLINQIKSGVIVFILIPEIPDKKLVYMMTENNLSKIIAAGGKVYKYRKGFNHAKTLVIDNQYAVVGTTNIDYRSMYLHFECGNLLLKTPCIKDICSDFLEAINKSKEVSYEVTRKKNLLIKMASFFLSIISPFF